MKKILPASLGLAILLTVSACNRMDRLLGKDNSEDKSDIAPTLAPAPETPGTRYDLYRDDRGAINTDPESHMFSIGLDPEHSMQIINTLTDGGKTENVRTQHVELNPVAGEGIYFVRIHTDTDGSGSWIMTFDRNSTGRTVDLSSFTSIVFMTRFFRDNRPLVAGDQIFLNVEDGNSILAAVPLQSATGLDLNSFEWQTVRIPVSALAGLDLSKIRRPFGLTYGTLGNMTHLDIDFDDVRWEL